MLSYKAQSRTKQHRGSTRSRNSQIPLLDDGDDEVENEYRTELTEDSDEHFQTEEGVFHEDVQESTNAFPSSKEDEEDDEDAQVSFHHKRLHAAFSIYVPPEVLKFRRRALSEEDLRKDIAELKLKVCLESMESFVW